MKSKNLVYTSFGDNTSFDSLWLDDNRNYHVWATYYGDDDDRYNAIAVKLDKCVRSKGYKFQNFYKLYNSEDLSGYERFFILDDDIKISTNKINEMFSISEYMDFDICGPSFDIFSKISHRGNKQKPKFFIRFCNYVEVNTMLLNKKTLIKLMEYFEPQLVGWGIDTLAGWVADTDKELKNIAIVDSITCTNPKDSTKKDGIRELNRGDGWDTRAEVWNKVADKLGIPRMKDIISYAYIFPQHKEKFICDKPDPNIKLAFCFMCYNNLSNEDIWQEFFEEGKDSCNIYSNVKNKDGTSFIHTKQIKNHVKTEGRYSKSLVAASNALLAEAYKDPKNEYFILLSGDSLPLYRYDSVYWQIIKKNKSWIKTYELRKTGNKASQFFILKRHHVKMIFDNIRSLRTKGFRVPDEMFYITNLLELDKKYWANVYDRKSVDCKISNLDSRAVKVKDLKGGRINLYRSVDSLFVRKAIDNININYNQLKK